MGALPMTFPPGRAKLATRLLAMGSPATANTIGMTDVACFAAMTFAVPDVTMNIDLKQPHHFNVASSFTFKPPARLNTIVSEPF